MKTPRPHQIEAIRQLKNALGRKTDPKHRPMLQMPTGAGKTMTAAMICRGALAKGKRVVFTVPALSLIEQTVDAFREEGITDVGVIQADHELSDIRQPIQIASIQTLIARHTFEQEPVRVMRKRTRKIPALDDQGQPIIGPDGKQLHETVTIDAGVVLSPIPADIVINDEAHRIFDFIKDWMIHPAWRDVPFIGLSATPWTKGLGRYYDHLIQPITIEELIEQGFLCEFRVFAPSHPDLSGVRTVAGDFHEGDLAEVMGDRKLHADIVETWLTHGEGRPTLLFAVNRTHAKELQADFEAAGVKTGYIDAYTSREEREEIRAAFHRGDIQIVCNVGCLTTGVDWDVRCIILARPTKSEMLFVQIMGRGLRTARGKTNLLCFDHTDTHLRLGFVTDIHHEKLDDGVMRQKAERKPKESLPKECPFCHFLKPPKTKICPACERAPEPRSDLECVDGDLEEMTPEKMRRKPTAEEKASFYGQMKVLARRGGKKPGWADHRYHERYGHWPPNKQVPEVEPTKETMGWITHSNIRRSYAQKRVQNAA